MASRRRDSLGRMQRHRNKSSGLLRCCCPPCLRFESAVCLFGVLAVLVGFTMLVGRVSPFHVFGVQQDLQPTAFPQVYSRHSGRGELEGQSQREGGSQGEGGGGGLGGDVAGEHEDGEGREGERGRKGGLLGKGADRGIRVGEEEVLEGGIDGDGDSDENEDGSDWLGDAQRKSAKDADQSTLLKDDALMKTAKDADQSAFRKTAKDADRRSQSRSVRRREEEQRSRQGHRREEDGRGKVADIDTGLEGEDVESEAIHDSVGQRGGHGAGGVAVRQRTVGGGGLQQAVVRGARRILVTGGAGFVGSHLVDRLLERGDHVIVVDNFFTGRKENVVHHLTNPRFELIRHDVVEPILLEVDEIYHLASPASPLFYKYNPIKTVKTNVQGTLNMLGLAKRVGAKFLLTSTSEVYGDPLQHPQTEEYWGNVNPIGVRSCYDEGKRVAETLTMDYHRGSGVDVRIARIFNTYGPRMLIDDGRVVSNFVAQVLRNEPLTVYGDGKQTRSFQYVSDLVAGLMKLMDGEHIGPFNLGNPGEFTMLELAEVVKETVNPAATVEFGENTADDPHMRKPDISKAKRLLGWEPKVSLREGLPLMVDDFKHRLGITT